MIRYQTTNDEGLSLHFNNIQKELINDLKKLHSIGQRTFSVDALMTTNIF